MAEILHVTICQETHNFGKKIQSNDILSTTTMLPCCLEETLSCHEHCEHGILVSMTPRVSWINLSAKINAVQSSETCSTGWTISHTLEAGGCTKLQMVYSFKDNICGFFNTILKENEPDSHLHKSYIFRITDFIYLHYQKLERKHLSWCTNM